MLYILTQTGGNTEKIWTHRLFARQKADMPKTHKMAAGVWGVL